MYDQAIGMHEIALRLVPDSPSTLTSLALVYAMTERMNEAIDCLHRSLGVRPSSGSGAGGLAATIFSVCIESLTTQKSGQTAGKGETSDFVLPCGPTAGWRVHNIFWLIDVFQVILCFDYKCISSVFKCLSMVAVGVSDPESVTPL